MMGLESSSVHSMVYIFCTVIFGRFKVIHYIMVEQQNESISRQNWCRWKLGCWF